MVDNVATKGGIFMYTTSPPFTSPQQTPTNSAKITDPTVPIFSFVSPMPTTIEVSV